ncbi:MAG: ChbG/HpnK family deacetylase [Saprospiraceae bacterium]|nr:ChbG/HpnK family deacetylase [Saprospiraceae bacterium]
MKSLQCLLIRIKSFCYLLSLATLFIMCGRLGTPEENRDDASHIQWSERLGYPSDHIVLILHADDLGMCEEANASGIRYLEGDFIQSGSAMPPCPAFDEFIQWAKANPAEDVGLHLTLTSEWKTYRWSALSPRDQVPGLTDPEGKMWRSVEEVVQHADAKEVNMEIRTQVEKAISMGFRPKHIDTHMGT